MEFTDGESRRRGTVYAIHRQATDAALAQIGRKRAGRSTEKMCIARAEVGRNHPDR
jgi:hypothetical protein